MTHTSTSPNYQILASLDIGRRQVELEVYALVKNSLELAMTLRQRIEEEPLLHKYFRLLRVKELILIALIQPPPVATLQGAQSQTGQPGSLLPGSIFPKGFGSHIRIDRLERLP